MRLAIILLCLWLITETSSRKGGLNTGRGGPKIGGGRHNIGGGGNKGGFRIFSNRNNHNNRNNNHRINTGKDRGHGQARQNIRPNVKYTNGFRTNVFSPSSTFLTRQTTTNTFIIRDRTNPYFYHGSYRYYWGPTYYHYHRHQVNDMRMCRYVFDTSSDAGRGKRDMDPNTVPPTDEAGQFLEAYEGDDFEFNNSTMFDDDSGMSNMTDISPVGDASDETRADESWGKVSFDNGTRVKQVSFGCRRTQVCCGLECCDTADSTNAHFTWGGAGIVLLILLALCSCYICAHWDDDKEYTVVQQTTTVETVNYPLVSGQCVQQYQPMQQAPNYGPPQGQYVPPPVYPQAPGSGYGYPQQAH